MACAQIFYIDDNPETKTLPNNVVVIPLPKEGQGAAGAIGQVWMKKCSKYFRDFTFSFCGHTYGHTLVTTCTQIKPWLSAHSPDLHLASSLTCELATAFKLPTCGPVWPGYSPRTRELCCADGARSGDFSSTQTQAYSSTRVHTNTCQQTSANRYKYVHACLNWCRYVHTCIVQTCTHPELLRWLLPLQMIWDFDCTLTCHHLYKVLITGIGMIMTAGCAFKHLNKHGRRYCEEFSICATPCARFCICGWQSDGNRRGATRWWLGGLNVTSTIRRPTR